MRVLQVNKFGEPISGAENYFLRLSARLAERGHEVAALCMRPSGVPDGVPVFEVADLDFHGAGGVRGKLAAARSVWSSPAAKTTMARALREFRPDVVHFHNIAHHLSQVVVDLAHRAGVRTVMTCHDYKMICPAYVAMRNGSPCLKCADGSPVHCATNRCMHGSAVWSLMGAAEAIKTRTAPRASVPDVLVCPSHFMAGAMRESWLRHTHTEVRAIPNPVALGAAAASTGGSTAVYVGRLSAEKGLALAVEASARSGVPLVIAGDGPERSNLEELSNRLDAPVSFVGFLSATELEAVWQQAAFKVMPSIWPENAPLAVLESMARGIPVIAADIGGLPELINSVAGGALVPPGDVNALADAMAAGAAGTINRPDPQAVISRFGWATHLEHVEDVYWGDSNVDSNGRSAERSRDPRRAGASSRGTLG